MANRDRQRPGLSYGPVRPSGSRDRGRIVGNLLGFLVVVVTIGALVGAIYFFVQSRGVGPAPSSAAPSAELTPTTTASPSPEPSATTAAAATPSASATLTASTKPTKPPITPGPTLFVPPVVSGPGFITFGTTVDAQLQVTDPKTTFAIDEPMVWSAYLTEAANSVDLKIRILKLDESQPTGEKLVREDPVQPDQQGTQIFFRRLLPIGASEGHGLFTIEYVRGEEILATGSFLVQ